MLFRSRVPHVYTLDPQLGEWVHTQRRIHNEKRMPPERVNLLNSIGFHWGVPHKEHFYNMYERLVGYKTKHNGNTRVPNRYWKDPQLGRWVSMQRNNYRNKKMSTEHASLLNSIGFDWEVLPRQLPAVVTLRNNAATIDDVTGPTNPVDAAAPSAGVVMDASGVAVATATQFRAATAGLRNRADSANFPKQVSKSVINAVKIGRAHV